MAATARAVRDDTAQLAVFVLFSIPLLFGTGLTAFLIIRFLPQIDELSLSNTSRGWLAFFWIFDTFMIVNQTVSQGRHEIDGADLLLTTVSHRAVTNGLLVAEFVRKGLYVALPAGVLGGAFIYATGNLISLLTLPLAVALFVSTSVVTGFTIGVAIVLLVARSPTVARYKTVLGVGIVLVFFAAFTLVFATGLVVRDVFSWLPIGWYVDLIVVGSVIQPSYARIGAVLATTTVILAVGELAAVRLTAALWYDEPITGVQNRGDTAADTSTGARSLDAVFGSGSVALARLGVSTPTRRVAQKSWLRIRRNPGKLTFLGIVVVVLGSPFTTAALTSGNSAVLPIVVVLLVPWFVGAAFALNPIGDEGVVLPITLSSSISGPQFVRGVALPAVLLGVPATVILPALTGVLGPYDILEIGGLVGIGLALVICSVPVAQLIGVVFPRFSALTARRSQDVVLPSMTALLLYSLYIGCVGGVTTLAYLASTAAPAAWFPVGVYVLSLVALLSIGRWSYYAVARRFEDYSI